MKHDSISSLLLYAYHSLFGHHGFFIYNTLAVFGLFALFYRKEKNPEDFFMIVLTLFFFFGLTILFSDNHSGGAYGNRWHVLIVPLTLYGLFCLEPHEFFERRIIVSIFAVMSTWGLVLARIGLLDPWTPYFLEEPSFVVQFESGPPYWDHEQKMSDGFLRTNHLHEALHFGELALRRDPNQTSSWNTVVTAAITLRDVERLKKYEAQIQKANVPQAFKEDIINAIGESLRQ